jgi:hypothetical protein
MFTQAVLSIVLANILSMTVALPFIAAQRSLASEGKLS